jgi:hypothetical protein
MEGGMGAPAAGAYNVRLKEMPFTESRASRNLQAIAISHCVIRGQTPDSPFLLSLLMLCRVLTYF